MLPRWRPILRQALFGGEGLVLLSNQDLAFYLTSDLRRTENMAKGGREFRLKSTERYSL